MGGRLHLVISVVLLQPFVVTEFPLLGFTLNCTVALLSTTVVPMMRITATIFLNEELLNRWLKQMCEQFILKDMQQ